MLPQATTSAVTYREATEDDALFLASRLRLEDVMELQAAHGRSVNVAVVLLKATYASHGACWVGVADGAPIVLFGVATGKKNVGIPWLLGSDEVVRHRRIFLRDIKGYLDLVRQRYPRLENAVWVGSETSIRWLRWLGFVLDPATPMGAQHELFHTFSMKGIESCAPR